MDLSNYLLISDLDGTLFDDQKRVPEANIKAIKAYEAEGGLFSIATGRTCASSRRHVNALEVNQPVILFNGSVLYDFAAEQAIWAQPMASSYVQIVQQIAKEHPEVGVEVLCVCLLYTSRCV